MQLARQQRFRRSLLDAADDLLPLLGWLRQKRPPDGEATATLAHLLERPRQPHYQANQPLGLSARESQALRLIAAGQSNKEIARSLNISPETVKWHLKNLYGKLNVSSRTQAMSRWRELGHFG